MFLKKFLSVFVITCAIFGNYSESSDCLTIFNNISSLGCWLEKDNGVTQGLMIEFMPSGKYHIFEVSDSKYRGSLFGSTPDMNDFRSMTKSYFYSSSINDCSDTVTVIDKQKAQEVTKSNINVNNNNNNNSTKQLSITEQLDKKISELNNLFKTNSNDNEQMKNELKKLEAKYSKVDPNSIPNEINTKIGMLRSKTSNLTGTLVNLETAIRILQELKNTDVFQKMIDFVRSNSKDLIDGKIVDFTKVFEQVKDKVNEVHDIEILDTESLLISTALSMCPELKVEHILKFNRDGILIEGIKINNSKSLYGFEFNKRFHLGIDKTWDIYKKS